MSKPSRLLLHIGMHKTGTTSLQRFFVRNRLVLKLMGIDYPEAFDAAGKRLPKHNDLFLAISHEKDFGTPHPILGASAVRVDQLARRMETKRITVLSAEGFSGESPAFAEAFAPLRGRFDIKVICFLRKQDDWVQTFYKQMVQSRQVRESRSFEAFLQRKSTRRHLNYLKILEWWAKALGEQAIRVEVYRPETQVLPVFLDACGLPKSLRWLPHSHTIQNRSLTSGHIERIRKANAAGAPCPLPSIPDEDFPYFTDEDRLNFMAAFEADNEQIRARFRPDLKRLFD